MHCKDLRAAGETEQRPYGLDAWEESPYDDDREQAALADLTLAVTTINGWNRLDIAGRTPAGSHRPAGRQRAATS
jgi:alkylhydroperoxidase family enzyme